MNQQTKNEKPITAPFSEGFSIQKVIDDAISDKREDRKVPNSWHPSRLGACRTGLFLERAGTTPDQDFEPRVLRIFDVGRKFEDWVSGLIKEKAESYEEQVRLEWPEQNVTGYADAVVNDKLVYEFKSKNSRSFWYMREKAQGPSEHNLMQLWVALKILNKKEGRLVYISKDDLSILEYVVLLTDPIGSKAMEELQILNWAWEAQLPPKPIEDPKDWRAKYCSWHNQCVRQDGYFDM